MASTTTAAATDTIIVPRTLVSTTVTAEDRAGTLLQRLDWVQDWTNLVVAGGCVANYLQPTTGWDGDIDLFLVSVIPLHMDEIKELCLRIFDWLDAANIQYRYERHSSVAVTVRIYFPDGKCMSLQLIYGRVCGSIQRLLESFDADICKCAYVGPSVHDSTTTGTVYQHTDFVECITTRVCTIAKHMYSGPRLAKYQRRYPTLSFQELTTPKAGFCLIFGQDYYELTHIELPETDTIIHTRWRDGSRTEYRISNIRHLFQLGRFPQSRYLAAPAKSLRQICLNYVSARASHASDPMLPQDLADEVKRFRDTLAAEDQAMHGG